MTSRSRLFGLLLGIFVALLLPSPVFPQLFISADSTATYPNDGEGLLQLLNGMLMVAKSDDRSKLQSMIRETEIPNYRTWFTTNFGQETGDSWAEPYGRLLEKHENEFRELLVQLGQMDGEFEIEKIDTAKGSRPTDGYLASWKRPAAPKSEQLVKLWDFFFIEGKFRWDSTNQYFPFQKSNTAYVVPAKLIKRVQPEYPEEARQKAIHGTVVLNVVLHKDGSVTVQNVAEGDPILSPAAIKAVRQWRYTPTVLNGQPVEVQTKISVEFSLVP